MKFESAFLFLSISISTEPAVLVLTISSETRLKWRNCCRPWLCLWRLVDSWEFCTESTDFESLWIMPFWTPVARLQSWEDTTWLMGRPTLHLCSKCSECTRSWWRKTVLKLWGWLDFLEIVFINRINLVWSLSKTAAHWHQEALSF